MKETFNLTYLGLFPLGKSPSGKGMGIMMIIKILSLILWLVVMPFCMGLLFCPLVEKKFRKPGAIMIAGYIFLFTLLELIGIPVVLFTVYNGFTIFTRLFTPCIVLCAVAGVIFAVCAKRREGACVYEMSRTAVRPDNTRKEISLEGIIVFFLFFILVGVQLYMAFTRASFDGDDAYYGVHAVVAQQKDTLYRINPYNGRSAPLDVRHALALFPIWEAYVGSMSGVHATIISHTVVPLVLIPLTYILYYQIGRVLLRKRKDLLPMFMVIIALWQIFGNISIYTPETFFLTRTWQGKSFAGSFVIPAVMWIFLSLFATMEERKELDGLNIDVDKEKKTGFWVLLACLNFAGGASSSLAILLSCLMSIGFAVLFAIRERKPGILLKAGFSCVPGGVYVLLYLMLTHGMIRV